MTVISASDASMARARHVASMLLLCAFTVILGSIFAMRTALAAGAHTVAVTVNDATMGSVKPSVSAAEAGTEVALEVSVDSWHYVESAVAAWDAEGTTQTLAVDGASFAMPDADVTVAVAFAERQACTVAYEPDIGAGTPFSTIEPQYANALLAEFPGDWKEPDGLHFQGWSVPEPPEGATRGDIRAGEGFPVFGNMTVVARYAHWVRGWTDTSDNPDAVPADGVDAGAAVLGASDARVPADAGASVPVTVRVAEGYAINGDVAVVGRSSGTVYSAFAVSSEDGLCWTGAFEMPDEDVVLSFSTIPAIPAECIVSFESNGGTPVEPQVVAGGAAIEEPEAPVRDGLTFDRWHSGETLAFENEVQFPYVVNRDQTLYAAWRAAVTESVADVDGNAGVGGLVWFDGDDYRPEFSDSYTMEFEPANAVFSAQAQDGYVFDHWEVDGVNVGGVEKSFVYPVDHDIAVVAVFRQAEPVPASDPIGYSFAGGGGEPVVKGAGAALDFTVKRNVDDETTFGHFVGVKVDGEVLARNRDYLATPGSVNISLQPGYLDSLGAGDHQIEVMFDDGAYSATFTVAEKDAPQSVVAPIVSQPAGARIVPGIAPTGDGSRAGLFGGFACAGVAAVLTGAAILGRRPVS